jgi:hypothetical protein
MAIDKPTDLSRIWAEGAPGGNVVDPGDVKFDAGWIAEKPPFQSFNFLQQLFTQAIGHNNEQGINLWDNQTVYPVGGLTKLASGVVYTCIQESEGNEPTASPLFWQPFIPPAPDLSNFLENVDMQVFNANGTFAANANRAAVLFIGIGGGGGGGGVDISGPVVAAGGAAGAFGLTLLTGASATASRAITIGSGGTGGTVAGTAGTTGGQTSIASVLTLQGGGGGSGSIGGTGYTIGAVNKVRQGGTGNGGALSLGVGFVVNGASGDPGIAFSFSVGEDSMTGHSNLGNGGGGMLFGRPSVGILGSSNSAGAAAVSNSGSGGGGGRTVSAAFNAAGGSGGSGRVIALSFLR